MGSLGEEAVERESSGPHILMVPLCGFGHHYQFLQLLRCCVPYKGVTVTLLSADWRIEELAGLKAKGEFEGIDLRLIPLFGPLAPYHEDKKFPFRVAVAAEQRKKEFQPFAEKMIRLKEKGQPGVPTCVMSDQLLCFAKELASELEVPWYSVHVSSPSYSSLSCLHFPKLYDEGLHPYESPRRNEVLDVPGGTYARVRDIPHENLEWPEYWHYGSEAMSTAAGLVYNSAVALEAPCGSLDAIRSITELKANAAHRQGPKVFAIGPLLNFPGFEGSPGSHIEENASAPCLQFLSTHPPSSVLYISFGSNGNISPESLTELAHGLEASGVAFLWALKLKGSLAEAALPPGFEERMKGRGFIETDWAPQAQILLHPSTGGFLSHCGWNSVLESLCGGVPVITWPIAADQPLNARFVENVAKSGLSVKDYAPGDEKLLEPSREDVCKSVRIIMVEEEGKKLKKNAQEWKRVLNEAVAEGGSSYKALHQFMDEVLLKSEGTIKK